MNRFWKPLAIATLTIVAAVGLTACAPATPSAPTVALETVTTVIDVRTPAEFAEGHLDGAINIDLQSPEFAGAIAQLDPAGSYILYCKSGNRAGQAVTAMESLGFTTLVNLGDVASASVATGLPVVQ
jgi:rhodanese-related sulfurtransferase